MAQRFRTFREFWPYYLQEHAKPRTRALHYIGTTFVILLTSIAAIKQDLWLLAALPIAGYGFAWTGHYLVERNRPATFRHPIWSLVADFRMWFAFLTGRIENDLASAGVRRDGTVDPSRRILDY